jgi:hypothetical protein
VWITAAVDAAGRPAVRTTITFGGALTLASWLSAGGPLPAWATDEAEPEAHVPLGTMGHAERARFLRVRGGQPVGELGVLG